MASKTKRKQSGRALFVDGKPELLSDLKLSYSEPSPEERRDGPAPETGWGSSSDDETREVSVDRLTLTPTQAICSAVCNVAFWSEVAIVERHVADTRKRTKRRGAKHLSTVADLLAYREVELAVGGAQPTDRELSPDPHGGLVQSLWDEVREVLERSWPDHPERRLSPEPPNRFRYYRFRKKYLTDGLLEKIGVDKSNHCVEAAIEIGLFDPKAGSHTRPDKTQLTYADGKWFPSLVNHTAKKRRDEDASTYKNHDGSRTKAPGMLAVFTWVRGPNPNERFMLTADIKKVELHGNVTDARIAVKRVLGIRNRHPRMREGHKGHVHDMAMSSEDHDMCLDDGFVGISHTPKSSTGTPSARSLGKRSFKIDKKIVGIRKVTAVDGAPTARFIDGNGDPVAVPLIGGQVRPRHRKRTNKWVMYRDWHLPDDEPVDPALRGATLTLIHNSSRREREHKPNHRRRTTALRLHPNYDPVMHENYGIREDSESANNRTAEMFPERRSNVLRRHSLLFKLYAVQHNYLNTALLNYARRTGADLSHRYGNYLAHLKPVEHHGDDEPELSARDGPLPLAA